MGDHETGRRRWRTGGLFAASLVAAYGVGAALLWERRPTPLFFAAELAAVLILAGILLWVCSKPARRPPC